MQFEVDEYGRVRHYGVPTAGGSCAAAQREPRRVVQNSKYDPLHGVAHTEYRKHERDVLELRCVLCARLCISCPALLGLFSCGCRSLLAVFFHKKRIYI